MMTAFVMAMTLISAAPSFDVKTLDGKTMSGSLVELSAGRAIIDTAAGRVSLDAAALLSISAKLRRPVDWPSDVAVELTDGSVVRARQCVVHGAAARITMPDGKVLEAPIKSIRTIRLQPLSDATDAEWVRLMKTSVESDLLVVRKGESLDYHKGVVRDVTEDAVQFDLDGELLPVKRSKVFALAYRHSGEADLPATVCRITDLSGSQWSVRTLTLSDKLQWTTPSGLTVSQTLDAIAQIDFSHGKIAYLSDLKPDSARWTPYFGAGRVPAVVERYYAPRFDRSVDARGLQLGGVEYQKGLALHSRTEIVYRLPERFGRFQAIAGLDDAIRPNGKIRLMIRGDDTGLLDTVITGHDAPRTVDLDLTGVRRLTIVVDFAESFGAGDYVLLCNARLTK